MSAAILFSMRVTIDGDSNRQIDCEYTGRPIRIPGALCGVVADTTGKALDQSEVELLDGSTVIATTRSDDTGHFTFRRVPAGTYSIGMTYFSPTPPAILVTDARASTCTHPVEVMLGVGSCTSSVWSGGGLRLRVNAKEPADVTIDGGYEGPRGGFNDDFELVELPAGTHHVEIEAVDYQSTSFDVTTRDFEVVTRTVTLKRIRP
jgi:hypothetical protein